MIAVGLADGLHLTVVYTDRTREKQMIRRVISARERRGDQAVVSA